MSVKICHMCNVPFEETDRCWLGEKVEFVGRWRVTYTCPECGLFCVEIEEE